MHTRSSNGRCCRNLTPAAPYTALFFAAPLQEIKHPSYGSTVNHGVPFQGLVTQKYGVPETVPQPLARLCSGGVTRPNRPPARTTQPPAAVPLLAGRAGLRRPRL